jgi:cation transport ATPase
VNNPLGLPRHLFDLGMGVDNLLHSSRTKLRVRFSVLNLTNRRRSTTSLSTFSGTHFVTPRAYQDRAASGTTDSAYAVAGDALDSKSATGAGTDEAPALIERADVVRIAFVGFVATIIGTHVLDAAGHTRLLGITATLIGGYPIFKEALENVFQRRMTMELSMTIALTAALAIGEEFTALVITGFVLVAEILET